MISITTLDKHIQLTEGTNSYYSQKKAELVRYNANSRTLEAYDDSLDRWRSIEKTFLIGLSMETVEVLEWAKKKMDKERELDMLAAKYPTIATARHNLEKELKTLVQLVKD